MSPDSRSAQACRRPKATERKGSIVQFGLRPRIGLGHSSRSESTPQQAISPESRAAQAPSKAALTDLYVPERSSLPQNPNPTPPNRPPRPTLARRSRGRRLRSLTGTCPAVDAPRRPSPNKPDRQTHPQRMCDTRPRSPRGTGPAAQSPNLGQPAAVERRHHLLSQVALLLPSRPPRPDARTAQVWAIPALHGAEASRRLVRLAVLVVAPAPDLPLSRRPRTCGSTPRSRSGASREAHPLDHGRCPPSRRPRRIPVARRCDDHPR